MRPTEPDLGTPLPATSFVTVPWLCWLVAVALGGLVLHFDEFGHRVFFWDMRGERDYRAEERVEDRCLWLAATAAAIGIVTSVVGLVVIRRSAGRVRGAYRLSIGLVFNLLALLGVLFSLFVRGLLNGPNAV